MVACFVFLLSGVVLKFFEHNEVLERIFMLERTDPRMHEIPDKTGVKVFSSFDKEFESKVDTSVPGYDQISKQLLLPCAENGVHYKEFLKSSNSYYIPVEADGYSFFESILLSLWEVVRTVPGCQEYTALHFKRQLIMYILDLFEGGWDHFMVTMLYSVWEMQHLNRSFSAWVRRFLSVNACAFTEGLFHVIEEMWDVSLRVHYFCQERHDMITFNSTVLYPPGKPLGNCLHNSNYHFTPTLPNGIEGFFFLLIISLVL